MDLQGASLDDLNFYHLYSCVLACHCGLPRNIGAHEDAPAEAKALLLYRSRRLPSQNAAKPVLAGMPPWAFALLSSPALL